MHLIKAACGVALLSLASHARAFIDPPSLNPENPVAGQPISVDIGFGVCDAVVSEPGYPQIVQDGASIRMVVLSVRFDDPEFCDFPVGVAHFALGSLSRGSFTLTVDTFFYDSFGHPQTTTLGVIPFVVAGPPVPRSVPAISSQAFMVLALALALAVAARRRLLASRSTAVANRADNRGDGGS